MNSIPSINEYYFEKDKFHLKSSITKYIQAFIVVLLVSFGFSPSDSTSNIQSPYQKDTWVYVKNKYTEFILASNPSVSKKEATDIVVTAFKWAQKHEVDPELVISIMKVESNFDKYAISGVGAVGLMQVFIKVHMDKVMSAKKELNNPEPFNIETNVFMGTTILKDCLDRFKFDVALNQCYSGGAGGYASKVKKVFQELKSS